MSLIVRDRYGVRRVLRARPPLTVTEPDGSVSSNKTVVLATPGSSGILVAASDASELSRSHADYLCDGIDDQSEIQAAIGALPASGGRVILSEGTFTTSALITAISNVTIEGCDTTVINGTVSLADTNYGIFYTTADISYFKLRNLRLNRLSGGVGGVLALNGASTYEYLGCGMYSCDCYSENSNCFPYAAGEGFEAIDCTFRASELVDSQATEIGWVGKPRFYNCQFIGAEAPTTAYGILFTDNGGGQFYSCYFSGKTYGALISASANPKFIGCEFDSWHNLPISVAGSAAPVFESCYIHPKIYSYKYSYTDTNEIPAPVVGEAYRILTIHVRVDIAQPGETLDIGTTFGGNEIATAVDIGTTGFRGITADWSLKLNADAPIYLTPSAPITIYCLRVMFSAAVDTAQASLFLQTIGRVRFTNCNILGTPACAYFTSNTTELFGCTLECPDRVQYALNYSAGSVAYTKNCTLLGATRNVTSYAYGPNSGTGSIASGTTSDVIAHGLASTPTAADITITLTEDPTNTPGAIWVDTIGAANFTVNCENDPGASNLDFEWRVTVP